MRVTATVSRCSACVLSLPFSLQRLHGAPGAPTRIATEAAHVADVLSERAGSETLPANSTHRPPEVHGRESR
jgi:hypothetical protein